MFRFGYVVVGFLLSPCIRCEKLNRNCRMAYLEVGLALPPCDRREKFNRNCRLGYLLVGCVSARVIGGRILIGIVGWDI